MHHRDGVAEALDEAPTICGVRAISGTITIAPRPCSSVAAGAQVNLGLTRSGYPVQQPRPATDACEASDAAREYRCCSAVSFRRPRQWSAEQACDRSRGVRRLRPLSRRAAPGGNTSASARAIVEQYSVANHSASATRSTGTPELKRPQRREQPLLGYLAALGQRHRPRPAPLGAQKARRASSRRPPLRATPQAGDSQTARATRGPWSSARPWRLQTWERRDAGPQSGHPCELPRTDRIPPHDLIKGPAGRPDRLDPSEPAAGATPQPGRSAPR